MSTSSGLAQVNPMWVSRRAIIIACFAVFAVLVALLLAISPRVSSFGPASREADCSNNLGRIRIALGNYHDDNGRFPPAHISDSKGVPVHSWRILLLKYIDKELYDVYTFAEPWNGPNNKRLWSRIPSVYRCPNSNGKSRFTNYVALLGPNSALRADKSNSTSETFVGTILVAEIADSDILWTEPRDLDVTDVDRSSINSIRSRLGSKDPSGPGVILGDLRTVRLR